MGALRVGMLLFGVGTLLASLAAVVFGVTLGCTEVACENPPLALAVTGASATGLQVFDGCNTCTLNSGVVGGLGLATVGVVVGGVAAVRDAVGE